MKLYVIRHAEPAVTGVFLGCKNDVPLKAAPPPFDLDVEVVYVSPLQRARQTAEGLKAPKIIKEDLREIDFGEWGGLSWDDIDQRWPEIADHQSRNWFGVSPPGGETWDGFVTRIRAVLKEILEDPRPKAIVAHGAVNAVIGGTLGGLDPVHFKQAYAEVSEFDV